MKGVTFRKSADTELFDCLASRNRRAALAVLNEAPGGVSEEELAVRVAATVRGEDPEAVPEETRREVRIALNHRDLPKLVSGGLVERETDEGTVVLTDHPALDDPSILQSIERPSETAAQLDDMFQVLADERRQRLLSILRGLHHSIDVDEAAALVAADEENCTQQDLPESAVQRVHTSIVHAHLPKLADAGLVNYDPDHETLTYEGHPVLRTEWLESGVVRRAADA